MTAYTDKFVQLHLLTSYPASNLNRDDLGRPKTVTMGNSQRLRVSSQSLKRAWRMSEALQDGLSERMGTRTKEIGRNVYCALTGGMTLDDAIAGVDQGDLTCLKEKEATAIGRAVAGVFGKVKPEYKGKKDDAPEKKKKDLLESMETEQIAHLTPAEIDDVAKLVEVCRESGKVPSKDELALLRKDDMAVDIALFGRMLAANKEFNVEAAAQVAHAMTVHTAAVEDDFFTAVDDLNKEDSGAGHMGVAEFGAGVFYLYVCIDREMLLENLNGDRELADKTLKAFVQAATTVSPTGKQNSFASRAAAIYCLAERGNEQPRTLSAAYLKPLNASEDLQKDSVKSMEQLRAKFNTVYGTSPAAMAFNVFEGTGSLQEVQQFITE